MAASGKSAELKMDENLFIVDLPPGKKYFGAKDPVLQAGQKEGTCWYYTFNWLRPRIGKLESIDEKKESKEENPALEDILKKRKIEKVLSQHRKQISQLDVRKKYEMDLAKTISTKEDAIKSLSDYKELSSKLTTIKDSKSSHLLQFLFPDLALFNSDAIQKDIDLLTKFIKQNEENSFKAFLQKQFCKDFIAISEATLKSLGHEPSKEIVKQIGLSSKPERDEHKLSLEEKDMLYHNIIVRVAADEYHLKFSNWHPVDGFNSLMSVLRKEGALAVGSTKVGVPFYAEKAKSGGKLGNYEVCYWPKGAKKRENVEDAHEILIVGAQRIQTSTGTQETVLFRDPNDASKPGEPIKIYRISYDALCKSIQNIHGTLNKTGTGAKFLRGPFAYCANPEYNKELEKVYSEAVTRKLRP